MTMSKAMQLASTLGCKNSTRCEDEQICHPHVEFSLGEYSFVILIWVILPLFVFEIR